MEYINPNKRVPSFDPDKFSDQKFNFNKEESENCLSRMEFNPNMRGMNDLIATEINIDNIVAYNTATTILGDEILTLTFEGENKAVGFAMYGYNEKQKRRAENAKRILGILKEKDLKKVDINEENLKRREERRRSEIHMKESRGRIW